MTAQEKKTYHTERCNKTLQAVIKTIDAFTEIEKSIGDLKPDDDYLFLELRYMCAKYKSMLSGFMQAKLVSEEYQGRIEFNDDKCVLVQ